MKPDVVPRIVRNLDNMVAHGINCIGVYIQGSNGGSSFGCRADSLANPTSTDARTEAVPT